MSNFKTSYRAAGLRGARIVVTALASIVITQLMPIANSSNNQKDSVTLVVSNAITGLNPDVQNYNLTTNLELAYLRFSTLDYYDANFNLITNQQLGDIAIVSTDPFKVRYQINPGQLWSDGTPITAVDLLTHHILNSTEYSKVAGLGNPNDPNVTPAFKSLGYGGKYSEFVDGLPTLSADKLSLTIAFKQQVADWKLLTPKLWPAHALIALEEGRTEIQSQYYNKYAKDKFEKAFYGSLSSYSREFDTDLLNRIGRIWSEDYNINKVDASTNPLLLISNGAYLLKEIVPNGSATLTYNEKYNSGPPVSGIRTFHFKVIGDGTAAAQALKNGEVDVYAGQPTADAVALLKSMAPAVKVIGGDQAIYEHVDLRVGPAYGTQDPYTGPFAGNSQKAVDLRTAFLMAYPREEIVDKLIKPINPSAQVMNSLMVFNNEPAYKDIIAKSGVSKFTEGTQASRTAKALALVKKHFPDAAAGSGSVKVKLLFGQPSNTRRVASAALLKAELAKAGFDVDTTPTSGWSSFLEDPKYDVAFFAWVKSAAFQSGNVGTYETQANAQGYSNATIDKIYKELGSRPMTAAEIKDRFLKVDTELMKDAVTLPIFQHPAANGVNAKLQGVLPSPFSPNLVWNIWDWYFDK